MIALDSILALGLACLAIYGIKTILNSKAVSKLIDYYTDDKKD